MTDTATQIAARLEACFVQHGFLEPGVDALRDASGVSLRTLYKYFPSREDMVVGALEYRHDRYRAFVEADVPEVGPDAIDHIFNRIQEWIGAECGTGCLFLNALSAHPTNKKVRHVVDRQKAWTRSLFGQCSGRVKLADSLFLLHEGATVAWPLLGPGAFRTARSAAQQLLRA